MSSVVGVVLITALVVTGAVLVTTTGGAVLDGVRDGTQTAAARTTLAETDARLSTLAYGDRSFGANTTTSTDLVVGPGRADEYAIDRSGAITVEINNGTCRATVPLTAISYRTGAGTLAYEAGGIWRTTATETRLVSPPDLRYRNRTIQLSVVNLSGTIDDPRVRATRLANSVRASSALERRLFDEPACHRPDAVTLTVESDHYRGWARYLVEEFDLRTDAAAVVDERNRTVQLTLTERKLPSAADDDRNHVVDFDGGYGRHRDGNFSVGKGVPSNTYPVDVTVLSGRLQGGTPTVLTHRERQPLDVMFTIDESGSMRGEKLVQTEVAATGFVTALNATAGDRVGVVGYSDTWSCVPFFNPCPPNYPTEARVHAPLSNDLAAASQSLSSDLRADGATPIAAGLNRTTDHLVARGDAAHRRVVVLLSDGEHNGDGNVTAAAQRAAKRDITVYTVGVGVGERGERYLETVANRTGGRYYYAADEAALDEQFERIAVEVTRSRQVRVAPVTVRTPTATLLANGSVGQGAPNGTSARLNARGRHSALAYGLSLRDGASLPVTVTTWACDSWAPTNRTVRGPDGRAFAVTRCGGATTRERTVDHRSAAGRVRTFTAANTTADVADGVGSWAERPLTDILAREGIIDGPGTLSLRSNQVVLAYDLADDAAGGGEFNDLVLLVEVGYASSAVETRYVVSLDVTNVRLGGRG